MHETVQDGVCQCVFTNAVVPVSSIKTVAQNHPFVHPFTSNKISKVRGRISQRVMAEHQQRMGSQYRLNAYRVLLTCVRQGIVVVVPPKRRWMTSGEQPPTSAQGFAIMSNTLVGTDKLTYLYQCIFREYQPATLQQLSKTQRHSLEVIDNVLQISMATQIKQIVKRCMNAQKTLRLLNRL